MHHQGGGGWREQKGKKRCCEAFHTGNWAADRRDNRHTHANEGLAKTLQVNAQLKGHLKGALNGGASVEQVRAVRQLAIHVCEAAGMRVLTHGQASWGWRTQVQDL